MTTRQDLPVALTLLRVVLALLLSACLLGVAVALALLVESSPDDGVDSWNGLVDALAVVTLLLTIPATAVTVAMFRLIGRSPVTGAKLTIAAGGGLCLMSLPVARAIGTTAAGWLLVGGVPVIVLAAIGLVQLTRRPRRP